jgi:putative membrane protein
MSDQLQPAKRASLSDYLAAERTLLAWIRTGLALMGFGFVVARFGLFLQEFQGAKGDGQIRTYGLSLRFGVLLIALGIFVDLLAGWNHIRLVRKLDRGDTNYVDGKSHSVIVSFLLALIGLAMTIYLLSI